MERIITQVLSEGVLVYRSYSDASRRFGYWYSLDERSTHGYGAFTGEFRLTRSVNLIDITHENFYSILKQYIKTSGEIKPEIRTKQAELMFPLGFDDPVFYEAFAKLIGVRDEMRRPLTPHIHSTSILHFNGRSRCSIHNLDAELLVFLKDIFGTSADGVISSKEFPDCIRNGMQHPELSLFDTSVLEFVRDIPRPSSGGSYSPNLNHSDLYLPPLNLDSEYIRNHKPLSEEAHAAVRAYVKTHPMPYKIIKIPYDPHSNQTVSAPSVGGSLSTNLDHSDLYLPPVKVDSEYIRNYKPLSEEALDRLEARIKASPPKYKITAIPYSTHSNPSTTDAPKKRWATRRARKSKP